jgi:hypothetical protein
MLVSPPQPPVAINVILVMSPNISCNITAVFSPQQSYGHSGSFAQHIYSFIYQSKLSTNKLTSSKL